MQPRPNVLAILLVLLLPCKLAALQDQFDLTHVYLKPFTLEFKHTPLTNALGQVGVHVDGTFVLFGVEVIQQHGEEPLISATIPAGSSLSDALRIIVQSAPEYTFKAVAPHLINVYPQSAIGNPDDVLNLHITHLVISSVSPSNFLSNPPRFIPELNAALNREKPRGCAIGPGLSDREPGIRLEFSDVTVRDALNIVSEQSIAYAERNEGPAFGWVYSYSNTDPVTSSWRVHDVWAPPTTKE